MPFKAFDAALVVTAFAALGCAFNAHTLAGAAQRNGKLSKKSAGLCLFFTSIEPANGVQAQVVAIASSRRSCVVF